MAPTRFSKPWPCAGIRLGATLSLWRRVHCERVRGPRTHFFDLGIVLRGRLRESCVLEVCWERAGGCVAALCRGDWVPGGFFFFFSRVANVRFAWQAAGIVRAGSMSGACPRAVSAALCTLMCSGRHWTVDPRGRRNESCAVGKNAGFRGPVRQSACAGARWALRNRDRRRESVDLRMGAGSGRFVERSGRLRRAFGAVPWNAAAGCDDGGRARRACGACGAVPWGLLLGVSPGCRCAMGIAAGRVAWVALCHGDCCWASRVGVTVPWGLLGGPSSRWRRVLGIADQGMVWVAPCH